MAADEAEGFYGVVVPEKRFHASPLCPYVVRSSKTRQIEMNRYPREADAIMTGHIKRCQVCFNMYRFRIRTDKETLDFLLDKYDMKVLLALDQAIKRGQPGTAGVLVPYTDMTSQEIVDTLRRLHFRKLVALPGFLAYKEVRGKRKVSHLGKAILYAYQNKLYGAPLFELEAEAIGQEKINKSLF